MEVTTYYLINVSNLFMFKNSFKENKVSATILDISK